MNPKMRKKKEELTVRKAHERKTCSTAVNSEVWWLDEKSKTNDANNLFPTMQDCMEAVVEESSCKSEEGDMIMYKENAAPATPYYPPTRRLDHEYGSMTPGPLAPPNRNCGCMATGVRKNCDTDNVVDESTNLYKIVKKPKVMDSLPPVLAKAVVPGVKNKAMPNNATKTDPDTF